MIQRLLKLLTFALVVGLSSAPVCAMNKKKINIKTNFRSKLVFQFALAIQSGDIETIEKLIKQGVNVNMVSQDGYTPLDLAAENGQTKVIQLLLANGADGNHALRRASGTNKKNTVVHLLVLGVDVNEASPQYGLTPLMLAAHDGHLDIVNILLRAGADVNAVETEHHQSALFMAAYEGHAEVVQALLGAEGIDINQAADMEVIF